MRTKRIELEGRTGHVAIERERGSTTTVTAPNQRHVKDLRFERDGCDGCDGLIPTPEKDGAIISKRDAAARATSRAARASDASRRASYSDSSSGAKRCGTVRRGATDKASDCTRVDAPNPLTSAALCDSMRDGAMPCQKPCGRNSVVECQLPKLDVEGSNPFARFLADVRNVSQITAQDRNTARLTRITRVTLATTSRRNLSQRIAPFRAATAIIMASAPERLGSPRGAAGGSCGGVARGNNRAVFPRSRDKTITTVMTVTLEV